MYKNRWLYIIGIVLLSFAACTPEQVETGAFVSKSDLKYSITQDVDDPNTIYLESLTPGVIPRWTTPSGYSTRVKDTIQIAFAGDYNFVYGAISSGGYVEADTLQLTLTTNNYSYVDDQLWTYLCDGVGYEKTWYLDLDSSGVSYYFDGPLYFYGTADSWETVTNGTTVSGDSWNWCPKWSENTWLMDATDFGSMTFSLIDGPNVTVVHKSITSRGTETGTYSLDVDNHTLTMTNAGILHDINRDGVVLDWGDVRVMSLTESTMQLAVLRDAALSGDGACLLVYNFVSKDYYDSNASSSE
ncbi:MAG: hypothetical protein H6Q14_2700 [Bacteroidetes bacterium]|jgi:hypothetical protein|nr:hypothetical protein [Bacteroidota bacterium]